MPDLLADHGWGPGHIGDLLGLAVFVQAVALLIAHSCHGLTRETYYCVTALYPSLYICIYLANLLPTHMWVCAATTLNILRALAQSVVIPSLSQIVADLAIDSPWRGRSYDRQIKCDRLRCETGRFVDIWTFTGFWPWNGICLPTLVLQCHCGISQRLRPALIIRFLQRQIASIQIDPF